MSMGGSQIAGDPSGNQIARTMREYDDPSAEDLDDGSVGPKGCPARGFMVTDAGGGSITVDTATEESVTVDVSALVGVYVPCAIREITGSNVVVLVFW